MNCVTQLAKGTDFFLDILEVYICTSPDKRSSSVVGTLAVQTNIFIDGIVKYQSVFG